MNPISGTASSLHHLFNEYRSKADNSIVVHILHKPLIAISHTIDQIMTSQTHTQTHCHCIVKSSVKFIVVVLITVPEVQSDTIIFRAILGNI